MKPQNNNYWSGFGLGLVGGVGLMYILGTKKGRTLLRDFLNNTDEIEHSVEDILAYINQVMPMSESAFSADQSAEDKTEEPGSKGLNSVMSKIRRIKLPKK